MITYIVIYIAVSIVATWKFSDTMDYNSRLGRAMLFALSWIIMPVLIMYLISGIILSGIDALIDAVS